MTDKKADGALKLPTSEIDLARVGLGEVAYVRRIDVEAVEQMIGQKVQADPTVQLYCLYMADGTPIAVSDSRDAAIESATRNDLSMISVH